MIIFFWSFLVLQDRLHLSHFGSEQQSHYKEWTLREVLSQSMSLDDKKGHMGGKKEWTISERRKKRNGVHGSLKDTFLASIWGQHLAMVSLVIACLSIRMICVLFTTKSVPHRTTPFTDASMMKQLNGQITTTILSLFQSPLTSNYQLY